MKQVYICFSTDIIHNGHLSILKKAADLGEVTGGIHGGNRRGGNAGADIVIFGRIAGANASAYVGK